MARGTAPQNVAVEMRFGDSWNDNASAQYHSLQYKFKPQSAGRQGQGAVKLEQNSCTFWSGHDRDVSQAATFQGQSAPVQSGQDCIAIFEDGHWRLELLSTMATNMRHIAGTGQTTGSHVHDGDSSRVIPPSSTATEQDQVSQQGRPLPSSQRPLPERIITERSLSPQPSTTTASQDPLSSQMHPSTAESEDGLANAETSPRLAQDLVGPPHGRQASVSLPQRAESAETRTSNDSGVEVRQPTQNETKVEAGATGATDLPDFEKEFFQESDSEDSDSVSSESSGNQSEEEAKHF